MTTSKWPWSYDAESGYVTTKDTTGDWNWTPELRRSVVCSVKSLRGISNGDLIAAAPAMLELLKTTASNIRSLGPAGVFGPYQVWLQEIEDVIAKAER